MPGECRRDGEGFVSWLGRLDHDDPAPGVGLCGGAGLRAAELVRNARPGRAGGRAGGLRGRDHAVRLDARVLRRPGNMPDPTGPTRSAELCGHAGITAPTLGWRRGSRPTISGRTWPRSRRRCMTRSLANRVQCSMFSAQSSVFSERLWM